MPGRSRRAASPLALAPLAALLLALGLLAPTAAGAHAPALTTASALSPQLEQLATPAVRAKPVTAQAEALGLPGEGSGTLVREGGRVIVEARFEAGALAALEAVRAAGAKVVDVSSRYQTLVLSVPPADLQALAAVPGISAVTPSLAPEVGAVGGARTAAIPSNGLCEGGSVITEGLNQLNVAAARSAFGARGAGETIGVISDSFNSATDAIEGGPIATTAHGDEVTNDLPGQASTCSGQQVPVKVIAEDPIDQPPPTDEGRAMLQIVHDLAPHANLAFATGNPSEISYAQNIEKLAAPVSAGGAGANVIVDDVGYLTEPFFQEGPIAVAIQKVTEEGVTYLTAAGNDNLIEAGTGNEIASWEAPAFRDAGSCPAAVDSLIDQALAEELRGLFVPACMDFEPGPGIDTGFGITVEPHELLTVDLQWAEPWNGVEADLDAFLVAGSGGSEEVIALGGFDNIVEQVPVEIVNWENESAQSQTVRLVINRCAGECNAAASETADPRLKFILLEDGRGVSSTEYPESEGGDVVGPTIFGHAGSAAAITLGAVKYTESPTAPKEPERYSSRGPVTNYFGPVTSTTPAAELTTPEELEKPNLTATDCASTTFFARFEAGNWHFCGTSEAAPHAAAVAALVAQTDPLASPTGIAAAMESSATAFTSVTAPDAVGAGLLNALAAMKALGGSPVDDPPSHVVPSLEEEANAPAPVVKITNGPKTPGNDNRPTFEFTSTRPVSFTCQIDGGTPQPCASPYLVPSRLVDGLHGFAVTGTDAEGRSGSSGIYSFTVDTKAPRTKIVGHPKKLVRTKKRNVVARFRLRPSESPVTFYCQFDKEPLRICATQFHHRFTNGRHAVRVRAKDAAGNIAAKPTVFHFRVKQIRPGPHRSRRSGG
jgi:Subtilase family